MEAGGFVLYISNRMQKTPSAGTWTACRFPFYRLPRVYPGESVRVSGWFSSPLMSCQEPFQSLLIDRSTCSFCKCARFWLADAVLRQYVPVQEQVLLPIGLCEDSRKTG